MSVALMQLVWPAAMVLARVGAFVFACPPLAPEGSIPLAKTSLTVALTWSLVLALPPTVPIALPLTPILWELAYGTIMGLVVRLSLVALGLAGEILDGQMGFAFSQQAGLLTGEGTGVVSQFLQVLGGLVFFTAGGQEAVVGALAASLRLAPPGQVHWQDAWVSGLLERLGLLLQLGLRLAAPLAFALMATQLALVALTRLAPALNIWGVGFVLTSGVGLLGLALLVPTWIGACASMWRDSAEALLDQWMGG